MYAVDVSSITAAPSGIITEKKRLPVIARALVIIRSEEMPGSMPVKRAIPLTEALIGEDLLGLRTSEEDCSVPSA